MKIGTIKDNIEDVTINGIKTTVSEKVLDINKWTIFKGVGLTAMITAITTVVTYFAVNLPKNLFDIKLKKKYSQVELLHYVLKDSVEQNREKSLQILLELSILKDKDGKLFKMLKEHNTPDWLNKKDLLNSSHKCDFLIK